MNLVKITDFNISLVIPALNAEVYLPGLLEKIETQTLLPKEIIIVDSSKSNNTADIIKNWRGVIPIIYQKVDFAYPGHARNIGIKLAKEDWIAFIDCRMLPIPDWLEITALESKNYNSDFVKALRTSDADTHFKKILRASTCGNEPTSTLAGSLVFKRVFEESGYFIPSLRAGEDIEWMDRVELLGHKITEMKIPTIIYYGFPESLGETIKKWFVYALAKGKFEVRNDQKVIYLSFLISISLFLILRWNEVMAQWNEDSFFFVPNITKIFLLFLFFSYMLYRGLIRPLKVKEKLSFLLPWRWLKIFLVGLCLDLAKAPGLILGSIFLLKRTLRKKKL